MLMRRNHYGRKPSKEFGEWLKQCRKDALLTLEDAAKRLGITSKKPGSYLTMIEKGQRAIPDAVLLNVSAVYNVSQEEVLQKAYWLQLALPMLTAVVELSALAKGTDEHFKNLREILSDEDKIELTRYAAFLIHRKNLIGVKK